MSNVRILIIVLCMTLLPSCIGTMLIAQSTPTETGGDEIARATGAGAASFPNSHRYRIQAKEIDQTFLVDVSLPLMPVRGESIPVIYVLDGNLNFALVAAAAAYLQQENSMPPAIIVSIGYEPALAAPTHRNRDLTPTEDEEWTAQAREAPFPFTLPDAVSPGGALAFLQFINSEVKPLVEDNYPVDRQDQTLIGHSLGGLFVLYTLFNEPGSFDRYIASSPSLWWDNAMLFSEADKLMEARLDSRLRLFLSVGGREPAREMLANIRRMNVKLREFDLSELVIDYYEFPGETHFSVLGAVMGRGLSTVFSDSFSQQPQKAFDWPDYLEDLTYESAKSTSPTKAVLPELTQGLSSQSSNHPHSSFEGIWTGGICQGRATDVRVAILNASATGATIEYARANPTLGHYSQRIVGRFEENRLQANFPDGAELAFAERLDGEGLKIMWRNNRSYCSGVLFRESHLP